MCRKKIHEERTFNAHKTRLTILFKDTLYGYMGTIRKPLAQPLHAVYTLTQTAKHQRNPTQLYACNTLS